jgi:hypothetical protein
MSVLDIGLCEHGNVYASINFLYHTWVRALLGLLSLIYEPIRSSG